MNLLADPLKMMDNGAVSPPSYWNGTTFHYQTVATASWSMYIRFFGVDAVSPNTLTGILVINSYTAPPANLKFGTIDNDTGALKESVAITGAGTFPFDFSANNASRLTFWIGGPEGNTTDIQGINFDITPVDSDAYNCDCDCGFPTATLAQMRDKIASLMGYSSQLAALPASVQVAIRTHLNLQQRLVVSDLSEINADRYFSWNAAADEYRFCTTDNIETCRNLLIATKISEAYWVGDGNVITQLVKGIPFQNYEAANPSSIPSRYEVRSCIEIWPRPAAAGKLVVRGTLAAADVVGDTDKFIVDETALLLRTLAFAKLAKGQEDASSYAGQYWDYIGGLVADKSMDERIIPNSWVTDPRLRERLTHVMEPRIYGP